MRDVQGLPPRDLVLVLEPMVQPGAEDGPPVLRVRVSANPDAPRVHLQQARVHRHEGPVGPFFRRLAEELGGATLRSIERVRGDRIVLFEFRDTPGAGRRALLAELTGRHANIVLLGRDDVVLDVMVPPPAKRNPPRLVVGSPWTPPGGRAAPPDTESEGIGATFPAPDSAPPGPVSDRAPLSWRVEVALGGLAVESHQAAFRKKLRARVDRKLRRARSLVKGLERRLTAARDAERVRMDGELLKSHLHAVTRGMTSIEVQDYFTEGAPPRVIALDAKRSPRENLERIFDRYRKLGRGRDTVAAELELARTRLARLRELAAEALVEAADPFALDDAAVADGLLDKRQEADPRKQKAPTPRLPYRVFRGSKGSEIRVGRTARDNDVLTKLHARGNDLWLHTADCPGSHVVVRLERGREPDEEEVLDAAHLAIHFSPARGTDRAPVHVARKKHVSKPRGAKPGLVTLSGGRILDVRVQPGRIEGLLRGARDRGGA